MDQRDRMAKVDWMDWRIEVKWTEPDQMDWIEPKWTEGTKKEQSALNWTKVDQIGPKWVFIFSLSLSLSLS